MNLGNITSLFKDLSNDVKKNGQAFTNNQLEEIANKIITEIQDVINEFKKTDKKWTWNPFKCYQIYQPVIKEVVEVVQVVGTQLSLSNDQKKTLAEILCWKVISPFLPNWVKKIGTKVIQWGINKGIETIYKWLTGKIKIAGKEANSEVFTVASVR